MEAVTGVGGPSGGCAARVAMSMRVVAIGIRHVLSVAASTDLKYARSLRRFHSAPITAAVIAFRGAEREKEILCQRTKISSLSRLLQRKWKEKE